MCNFKILEKVVCVRPVEDLKKNEIYTIEAIIPCKCGITSIAVFEHKLNLIFYNGTVCDCGVEYPNLAMFRSNRFRKLDNSQTEEILSMILEANKEELIKI